MLTSVDQELPGGADFSASTLCNIATMCPFIARGHNPESTVALAVFAIEHIADGAATGFVHFGFGFAGIGVEMACGS